MHTARVGPKIIRALATHGKGATPAVSSPLMQAPTHLFPTRRIAKALLLLMVAVATTTAHTQQRYELTDDGWAEITALPAGSPEAALQDIRRQLAQEQSQAALQAAQEWIETHPAHNYMPQALLLRGDAHVALGQYWESLYDYEQLIIEWPASAEYLTAVEREYAVAQVFIGGWKRKLLGLRILPTDGEGEELLIRVQERTPGSAIGERASLALADYYFGTQEMGLAAEAYDLFLGNYPQSDRREWAMLRLIQSNLARFKGPEFDGTGLLEADERLALYAAEFPAAAERIGVEALRERIAESLAKRDLTSAAWYDRRGDAVAAASVYRRLVRDFPQTTAARDAVRWLETNGFPVVETTAE